MIKRILLIFTLVASTFYLSAQSDTKAETIEWLTFEEAVAKTKESPKKIFIDVYTDWCGWCKVMDRRTFTQPAIIEYMNENFYAVKLNGEQKETITFADNEFKFIAQGRKGYHELAAALLEGQLSYPSCVVMSEKLERITTIPGFRDPAQMDTVLRYLSEEHYKTTPYADFETSYDSPLPTGRN